MIDGLSLDYYLLLNSKHSEHELELIQTQMAQKPMLRAEVEMHVRCANKVSAECSDLSLLSLWSSGVWSRSSFHTSYFIHFSVEYAEMYLAGEQ